MKIQIQNSISQQDEETIAKQFVYLQPNEAYATYQFLCKPGMIPLPFPQFVATYIQNNFDVEKTLSQLLGVVPDQTFKQVINTIKLYRTPFFYMQKSMQALDVEYLGGDKNIYEQFVDCNNYGLIKSLEIPGKQSKEAYFLCNDKNKLFVKPVEKEDLAKNELNAYETALAMNLDDYVLPITMVKLKKSNKFATITPLLKEEFVSLQDFEKKAPGSTDGIINTLVQIGEAHKLALYDLLIKNCDRHKGNLFTNGMSLVLIDNGLAFNNVGWKKFVPGYLRNSEFKKSQILPLPNADFQIIYSFVNKIKDAELKKQAFDILKLDSNPYKAINIAIEAYVGK